MPIRRDYHQMVALGTEIYIIGGKSDDDPAPGVDIFDTVGQGWTTGPDPLIPRLNFGAAVLNGRIYVAGGTNPRFRYVDTAEMLDPATGAWQPILPPPYKILPVMEPGIAVIYMIGYSRDNDDAILRWNACVRTIQREGLQPRRDEPELPLE